MGTRFVGAKGGGLEGWVKEKKIKKYKFRVYRIDMAT